jgi:hypothetical protein
LQCSLSAIWVGGQQQDSVKPPTPEPLQADPEPFQLEPMPEPEQAEAEAARDSLPHLDSHSVAGGTLELTKTPLLRLVVSPEEPDDVGEQETSSLRELAATAKATVSDEPAGILVGDKAAASAADAAFLVPTRLQKQNEQHPDSMAPALPGPAAAPQLQPPSPLIVTPAPEPQDLSDEISYTPSFEVSEQIASSVGSQLDDSSSRSPIRSPPPAPRGHSVNKDHAIMERWNNQMFGGGESPSPSPRPSATLGETGGLPPLPAVSTAQSDLLPTGRLQPAPEPRLLVDDVEIDEDIDDIDEDIELSGGSFAGTDEYSTGEIPRLGGVDSGSDSYNSYGSADFSG